MIITDGANSGLFALAGMNDEAYQEARKVASPTARLVTDEQSNSETLPLWLSQHRNL